MSCFAKIFYRGAVVCGVRFPTAPIARSVGHILILRGKCMDSDLDLLMCLVSGYEVVVELVTALCDLVAFLKTDEGVAFLISELRGME